MVAERRPMTDDGSTNPKSFPDNYQDRDPEFEFKCL